jgi:hypothetical protein
VNEDEYRVEIDLDDEEHGYSLGERLRAHDLDDDARKRLGRGAIVTRDGSRLFLYATDEASVREAERVARELLEADRLTASIKVTRWHPVEEAWKDASLPLPGSDADVASERAQKEADHAGGDEWEVHVELPGRDEATELARRLEAQGLRVHHLWRYVSVDAATDDDANELAERLRSELPDDAELWVAPNREDLRNPVFVFFESKL